MLTKKQDNRYKAYDNLHQALTLDPAPYQQDQALQAIIARLGLLVKGIKDDSVSGTRKTKGITQDKSAARDHLTTVAAELAGDLFAYATQQQSATLQAEANYNKADLAALSGTRLGSVVGLLRQRLTDHAPALAAYAVDAARVQELDAALLAYDQQRNNPRQQVTQNAAVRVSTGERFRLLGSLVKDELLRAMRKYERRAPAFYTRVRSAREVLDQPATHQTPPVAP